MPVNASMYAKLKYTPWTDCPYLDVNQLSKWNEVYNSL